jgi:hypothetical protein
MAKTQFKSITSETDLYPASDLYTKDEIDSKISSAINYKGSVETYAQLPTTGNKVGDMWNVKATKKNYIWAANPEMKDPPEPGWDEVSGIFEVDAYTKDQSDAKFVSKTDVTTALSGLAQFKTSGYTLSELVTHYNGVVAKLQALVTALTPTP